MRAVPCSSPAERASARRGTLRFSDGASIRVSPGMGAISCIDFRRVRPTPATHAILAQLKAGRLKAGETVYQAGELPATLRVSKIHYEPPKAVCKTPFASIFPPSMENGDGTRYGARSPAGSNARRPPSRVSQLSQGSKKTFVTTASELRKQPLATKEGMIRLRNPCNF